MSDALRDYGQRDETVCVKESEEITNEKKNDEHSALPCDGGRTAPDDGAGRRCP